MSFSWDAALPTKKDEVRFWLGDVDAEAYVFEDETIYAFLAKHGNDIGKTLIDCAKHVIALLSRPDYTADWLKVDHATARASWQTMLAHFESRFNLASGFNRSLSVSFIRDGDR